MATEGTPGAFAKVILTCFILLFVSEFISCYSYPLFGSRRYLQTVPISYSSYFPYSLTHHRNQYPLPDYDNEIYVNPQEDYEYNAYEKHPYMQYFGYYPSKDYYRDKTARKNVDGFEYFDDRIPQDSENKISNVFEKENRYPYGQETWYEDDFPRYDNNAETKAAFLQNLILAQMYQDSKSQFPYGYDSTVDDYNNQNWFFGMPTTDIEPKNKLQDYLEHKVDEEVTELESLTRQNNNIKALKNKDTLKNQKYLRPIEKPKSKMTDDEYFELQKQIIVNNRKNNHFKLKKQSPVDVQNNFWDFSNGKKWPSYLESATNSIKKLNVNKNAKSTTELGISNSKTKIDTFSTASESSTAAPKRPSRIGQKEVVLPRPSNPVRRPFPELSTRSINQPLVYDTIRKLLNMNKDLQKSEMKQPQKRFVLNEDQLTAELSGLKKLSA